jgi:SAM-dependent methyltransferase
MPRENGPRELSATDRLNGPLPSPMQEAIGFLDPASQPSELHIRNGYLDLLGEADPTGSGPIARFMLSGLLARIYERTWRPLAGRALKGFRGPGMREERQIAIDMLALSPGDRVLDVACGPGNFTRDFARVTTDGLVVGIDASATMLTRAVRETSSDRIAYVRGDAAALPFRDDSFDAVCCFAALYLIEDPMRALDEIARVLAPGGRVALMSTYLGEKPRARANNVALKLGGVRIFTPDELTGALSDRGLLDVEQEISVSAQFVSGRHGAGEEATAARAQ